MTSEGKRTFVRLMGGLGNQMFQYAAARHHSTQIGSALYIDVSMLGQFATPRAYELGQFPLKGVRIDRRIVIDAGGHTALVYPHWASSAHRASNPIIRRIVDAVGIAAGERIAVLRETAWRTSHADCKDVILVGYWQSQKFFDGSADEIRRDFDFSSIATDRFNAAQLDQIRTSESVGVHVRRGDYLSPGVETKLGLCTTAYFRSALARLREILSKPRFFVFSDDIDWCRAHLGGADVEFVAGNSTDAPVHDLRLIAACRHQVISNSSFSWWAAWLAAKPNHVIAPWPWYSDATPGPDMPASWQVLDRATGAIVG